MQIRPEHVDALRRYARAERSDPFVLARGMAHLKTGVAGYRQAKGQYHQAGDAALYDAEPFVEERKTPNGETYMITAYKNRVRP